MTNDGKTFEREVYDLLDDINEFIEKEFKYFEKQGPFLRKVQEKEFIFQRPPSRWEERRLVEIRKRWVRVDSYLDSYLLKVSALYKRIPEDETGLTIQSPVVILAKTLYEIAPEGEIKLKDILEKLDAEIKSLKENLDEMRVNVLS